MQSSDGHLLGGRVRYAQPIDGYRTGIEPVLLAAAIPAQPGERVLEAGTGAGAGLLCLLSRVAVHAVGIERDPDMAALARRNLAENGFSGDILAQDLRHGLAARVDHAFANPPWHDPRSTGSPVPRRRQAMQAEAGLLETWIAALAALLPPKGSLSLILPAPQSSRAGDTLQQNGFGKTTILDLRPKPGRAAKLAIIQAYRGEPSLTRAPDLVLHQPDGTFTPEADAILRRGAALKVG